MSDNGKFVCQFCSKTFTTISNCRRHEKNTHNQMYAKFKCPFCEFACSKKDELHEHTILNHAGLDKPLLGQLPQEHTCNMCGKKFANLSNCRRHKKDIHGIAYHKHKCLKCEFSCSNANELLQHTLAIHSEVCNSLKGLFPREYSCPYCERKFSKFVELIKHKKAHLVSKIRSCCSICKKSFSSVKNCKRHEKNFHGKFNRKFPCSICEIVFFTKNQLLEHVSKSHPNSMKAEENLIFDSWQDFKNWKTKIEKETVTSYVRRPYSSSITVYTCHRSGYFKSKSKGVRHLKLAGTSKINSFCPASITVKSSEESSSLKVSYFPTHLGHNFDVKHIRLSENEKEKIAGQLIAGVPADYILNEIAETSSPTGRFAVTTAQDIRNVRKKYQINGNAVRDENDVLSVEAWIHEMIALEKNPILLYKLPGENNPEYPDLEKDDFILGFMNEAQEEIFKLYGSEIICIDSTHGTNQYNIQLTSVIIKDDNWEGFPVAFLWSNRQHESVFKYFFLKVKERTGDFTVNSFMSDDYIAFFNAWCAVFSEPNFYLLCDWHVKRALKKSLTSGTTKVKNEKATEVLNRMFELVNETDEDTFKTLLNLFTTRLLNDPDTLRFANYFIDHYASRSEQWAACYRVDARINTNMTVERWHKDLKYNSDLKGKCGGRLDKAIHSLLKNLRLKLLNRLTSLQRGKLTKKICLIRKTHKIATETKDLQIFKESESTWIITSSSQVGETYKIKVKSIDPNHTCNLVCSSCNICLHNISCTCPNYAIRYNMCKHIHVFCLKESVISNSQQMTQNAFRNTKAIEELAVLTEKPQKDSLSDLKSDAISMLMNLVPDIQEYSKEQCQQFIKGLSILKSKCEAMKSTGNLRKSLPSVVSNLNGLKKVKPQRSFPLKKKTSVKKMQTSYKPADTLKNIISSRPEAYEAARAGISTDHTYSENI